MKTSITCLFLLSIKCDAWNIQTNMKMPSRSSTANLDEKHAIKSAHISKINDYINIRKKRNNKKIENILNLDFNFNNFTAYLQDSFSDSQVVGLDISAYKSALDKQINPEKLQFDDSSFDIVNINYLCSTVPRDVIDNVIMECSRILCFGGILSIIDIQSTDKTKSEYMDDYVYWCSRAQNTLNYAGFVSLEEHNDLPNTNIKLCWKSLCDPTKFKEQFGDYDRFVKRRNSSSQKPFAALWASSSIVTLLFQIAVAYTYANLIITIFHKFF